MKVEHLGFFVKDALAQAEWYREQLGFKILIEKSEAAGDAAFIQSEDGLILELLSGGERASLADSQASAMQFHLAIKVSEIEKLKDKLVAAGAEFVMKNEVPAPAKVLIVKDPWGNSLQLAERENLF